MVKPDIEEFHRESATRERRHWRGASSWPALAFTLLLALALLSAPDAVAKKKNKKEESEATQSPVFYPSLPNTPRVQYLATFNGESDVKPKKGRLQRFALGDEDDSQSIIKPYGVALNDGKLFVCDIRAGFVMVLGLEDKTFKRLGSGKLKRPINLVIDEDGKRYVADAGLGQVVAFDEDDRYLRAYGDPETMRPVDVAISGNLLYVCDRAGGSIAVLDKTTGEELRRVGALGSDEGELYMPTNLALGAGGSLYVTDSGNARVLQFDAEGRYLRQYSSRGLSVGLLARPKGIAVDRSGRLYVVDASFENVQIFDPDGKLLLFFGAPGNGPGGINLPVKVVIDYDHVDLFKDRVAPGYEVEYLLLVTSQFGLNKVNVYGFLKTAGDESASASTEN